LAGGPLGESVGCTEGGAGVWARVGKRWAERGNIGFSEDAAPVKARAMSYGLAFGSLSVGLSVGLSVCLCPTDLPGVRTCLGYFLPRVRPSRDLHLHLPPKPFSAIIVHLCRLCCARVNTRARARVHTHTHTHTHTHHCRQRSGNPRARTRHLCGRGRELDHGFFRCLSCRWPQSLGPAAGRRGPCGRRRWGRWRNRERARAAVHLRATMC